MSIMQISNIRNSLLFLIIGCSFCVLNISPSAAENLAAIKLDKCNLSLASTAVSNNYRLSYKCEEPYFQNPQVVTAFTLENPSRLVIDINGLQLTAKDSVPVNSDELGSIRLGITEGKTRTVVDIKIPIRPLYSITRSMDGKSLDIDFALKVSTQNIANSTGVKYQEDIKGDELKDKTVKTSEQKSSGSISTIGKNDGRTELKAVLFKSIGIPPRGGALFDLQNIDHYTLTRENDKRYRLVIEKTKLGSNNLLLPQYAPESVEGLEIILLREEGENVSATIYVKDKVMLAPYIVNGKLWIKVSN